MCHTKYWLVGENPLNAFNSQFGIDILTKLIIVHELFLIKVCQCHSVTDNRACRGKWSVADGTERTTEACSPRRVSASAKPNIYDMPCIHSGRVTKRHSIRANTDNRRVDRYIVTYKQTMKTRQQYDILNNARNKSVNMQRYLPGENPTIPTLI